MPYHGPCRKAVPFTALQQGRQRCCSNSAVPSPVCRSYTWPMPVSATFLQITDAHIAGVGTEFRRDEHKVEIPGIAHDTREAVLEFLFGRLAERLRSDGRALDG